MSDPQAPGAPLVSVVMATFGRGAHILPSIRSVLGQNFGDWELLVVGDCCTDETEEVVGTVDDPRVRWLNLAQRCESQSGPNNAGIAAAAGRYIAYLGHDDIWDPSHLERLVALFEGDRPVDFAVSGTIFHLPNGIEGCPVHGIFEDGSGAEMDHFFPPSSIAHRKSVCDRIGSWRMPFDIRAPVDEDFLIRAARAGLVFGSTGVVTVHKFAAGHRYLSYVEQRSDEQEEMLAAMHAPGHATRVEAILDDARRRGTFMTAGSRDFERYAPGELARRNAARKGLNRRPTLELGGPVTVRHQREPSAFDWRENPVLGIRWTKQNPRPRLLLPVRGCGSARLSMSVVHRRKSAIGPLTIVANGAEVTAMPRRLRPSLWGWRARYEATLPLREDGPSVIELRLTAEQTPANGHRGIGVGPMKVIPEG